MNIAKIHAENKGQKSQKYQIFLHGLLQRAFSFRRKIYKATLLSFMLLLSACHTHFSKNDTLSSLDSSETIKPTSNNNMYVTLSTIQHPRILQFYGGAYYDAKLDRLLTKIVRKLTAVSHNPQQNYSVTILNSESVNAFALPGGFIYITRGMLALANDSSEVAAILAHEIAHITAKHGILRLQKAAELKKTNHTPAQLFSHAEKKTPIENKQQIAQFSRNQELQADSLALDMLQQAGYDPFASSRFLQTMEAYRVFRKSQAREMPP